MYGLETHDIAVPSDVRRSPFLVEKRFGPKRKMTNETNTSISGIAVLGDGVLTIYHNVFAAMPLNPQLFRGLKVRHFSLGEKQPGQVQDWIEISI
jgi:hypothetical protein